MRNSTLLVALTTALLATACGGGGSSNPAPDGGAGVPSTSPGTSGSGPGSAGSTKPTEGIWQGTVSSQTTGTASVMGFTDSAGHGVWMATDGRVWAGQTPMSGTQMTATVYGFMYPGRHFPDGTNFGRWSMTGAAANGAWNGQLNGAGDTTAFQFRMMQDAHDRPASLTHLAGTYTRTTSIGYALTVSFTQDGQMTGSDTRGCVFNGTVTVPDATHNLYQIRTAVSSCGTLDGQYEGHGTLLDATAMQSWMGAMGCFQYGSSGMPNGERPQGGTMGGGMMGGSGGWWPDTGTNTVPSGTNNLFMFAMTDGKHAIMDALAR